MHALEQQKVRARLQPLVGQKAWGVKLGQGSFITLEFGRPVEKRGVKYGEWHFWVTCCAWRLDGERAMVAGSDDPREELAEKVKQLDGRTLQALELSGPAGQTELRFDGGLTLTLFPFASDLEHYKVFIPDGQVLIVGPGSEWSEVSAS
jgi:hypothetical protein